jgi:hypothetical protein
VVSLSFGGIFRLRDGRLAGDDSLARNQPSRGGTAKAMIERIEERFDLGSVRVSF